MLRYCYCYSVRQSSKWPNLYCKFSSHVMSRRPFKYTHELSNRLDISGIGTGNLFILDVFCKSQNAKAMLRCLKAKTALLCKMTSF